MLDIGDSGSEENFFSLYGKLESAPYACFFRRSHQPSANTPSTPTAHPNTEPTTTPFDNVFVPLGLDQYPAAEGDVPPDMDVATVDVAADIDVDVRVCVRPEELDAEATEEDAPVSEVTITKLSIVI